MVWTPQDTDIQPNLKGSGIIGLDCMAFTQMHIICKIVRIYVDEMHSNSDYAIYEVIRNAGLFIYLNIKVSKISCCPSCCLHKTTFAFAKEEIGCELKEVFCLTTHSTHLVTVIWRRTYGKGPFR